MGYASQTGQLGFRTQGPAGVYADPGVSGVFALFKSGGMSGDRELIIPDPEIGGDRDIPDAYLGPIVFTGSFEAYARMEVLATLLKAVAGSASSSVAGTGPTQVGTHTITPANALVALSVEEVISDTYEAFQYVDVFVNSLHLEAEASGYLTTSFDLIAKSQTAGITPTASPDIDTTPLIVGSTITVEYNSIALPAKSFSFDIMNNIEDDDFRLGSISVGDLTPKRREVTAGLTIRPEDSDLWRQATYGSSVATSAQAGAAAKQPLVITCESYAVIGSSTDKYTLSIELPNATIKPFKVEPSGDDVIEHDIEIQALRPAAADPVCEFVVKNALATVL